MSEENKALVRRWFAEVDQGNPTIEDELLPPDYIDHDPDTPGLAQERFTIESDLTFLPFVDMKASYRRVVPEDAPDENQALLQWHFYY